MSFLRIPPGLDPELIRCLRDIETHILKTDGVKNNDFHGRRIINAGSAQDDGDYVTLLDVKNLIAKSARPRQSSILAGASGLAGGGSTGGGGGGLWVPTVPVPDDSATVDAYAAANPAQLANSCLATGGTWDFMDGLVAALQAVDPRYGFNARRGDVNDPSEDAVSYYTGVLSEMAAGSIEVFVFDVIGGHCGPTPSPAWQNVTVVGSSGARWLPTRP